MNTSSSKSIIFITGATGLVGSYLLKLLLQNGHKVYTLSRSKNNKSAKERVVDILNFWDKKVYAKYSRNLEVLEGDVTKQNLGLNKDSRVLLKNDVEEIFHSAGITEFNWPLKDIRMVNVEGTRNVLDFALMCKNLKKINHISTAYICGDYTGKFKETDLDVGQKFNTTYEQSKFEAEKLIGKYRKKGLGIDILRPPIILGESKTGKTSVFQGFYQTLHLWSLEIFDVFPGKDVTFNVIPIDILSKSIIKIAAFAKIKNINYHLISPQIITSKKILNLASKMIGFKKPKLVHSCELNKYFLTPVQRVFIRNNIFSIRPGLILDSSSTNKILQKFNFRFPVINDKVIINSIKYAIKAKFLKRKK